MSKRPPEDGRGRNSTASNRHWLDGVGLDPIRVPPEPLPTLPGFPYLTRECTVTVSGPTGGGRSALVELGLYDAGRAGLRGAYLGSEVTPGEFDARAASIARTRDDELGKALLCELHTNVRYLDLASTLTRAASDPASFIEGMATRYDICVIDPLSAVASTLDLNFDSNADYLNFHDKLVEPLKAHGLAVLLLDNIGHGGDAQKRPSGASAKINRPDLVIACRGQSGELTLEVTKRRSVRSPVRRGDKWAFSVATQQIAKLANNSGAAKLRRPEVMERASRAIESGSAGSHTALRKAVGGKAQYTDQAVCLLIAEGYIEERLDTQPRYVVVNRYREDDDVSAEGACPLSTLKGVEQRNSPVPSVLERPRNSPWNMGNSPRRGLGTEAKAMAEKRTQSSATWRNTTGGHTTATHWEG